MSDLDLETIQKVVDLGPYKLLRCKACRGVNLGGASPRCGWCGADLGTGVIAPGPPQRLKRRSRRGPSGARPRGPKRPSRRARTQSPRAGKPARGGS